MNWITRALKSESAEDKVAAFKADLIEQRDIADLENMLFDACRVITQMRKEINELDEITVRQMRRLDDQSVAISNLTVELKALHTALPKMSKGGCNCDCNKTY